MDIATEMRGNVLLVSVQGRVDSTTAPKLGEDLSRIINAGQANLVLDLSRLDYISSAGLRAALLVAKLVNAKNGKLVLASLQGPVKQVFEISGLYPIFTVSDTPADALAQF